MGPIFHANLLAVPKETKIKINSILLFLVMSLFFAIGSLNLNAYSKKEKDRSQVEGVNTDLLGEKIFWEEFLEANPLYLEGWHEVAQVYKNLGDENHYKYAVNKIENLNPNDYRLEEM